MQRSHAFGVYDQNLNKLYTIDVETGTFHHLRVVDWRNNEALFTKVNIINVSGILDLLEY